MLIKLILSPNKAELYLDSNLIKILQKNPTNPLETLVTTSIISPKGPMSYVVLDNMDEVAEAVNRTRGKETSH
jgi:hypothetical protein